MLINLWCHDLKILIKNGVVVKNFESLILGVLKEDLFYFSKNNFSEIFIFTISLLCTSNCNLPNYSLRYKGPILESRTRVWYKGLVRYKSRDESPDGGLEQYNSRDESPDEGLVQYKSRDKSPDKSLVQYNWHCLMSLSNT